MNSRPPAAVAVLQPVLIGAAGIDVQRSADGSYAAAAVDVTT
jgi:hypothetical protein